MHLDILQQLTSKFHSTLSPLGTYSRRANPSLYSYPVWGKKLRERRIRMPHQQSTPFGRGHFCRQSTSHWYPWPNCRNPCTGNCFYQLTLYPTNHTRRVTSDSWTIHQLDTPASHTTIIGPSTTTTHTYSTYPFSPSTGYTTQFTLKTTPHNYYHYHPSHPGFCPRTIWRIDKHCRKLLGHIGILPP